MEIALQSIVLLIIFPVFLIKLITIVQVYIHIKKYLNRVREREMNTIMI